MVRKHCFKGSTVWNTVPNRFKNLNFLYKFKQQIKMWKPTAAPTNFVKHVNIYFKIHANFIFFT